MMRKNYSGLLLFLLLFWAPFSLLFAQVEDNDHEKDRIEQEIAQNLGTQNSRQEKINKYIFKAKKNNDKYKLYTGYSFAVVNTSDETKAQYGDSLIDIAIKNKDNRLIALAYQSSGRLNLEINKYAKSLDHLLLSLEYFAVDESKEYVYPSTLNIGRIKQLLGDYAGSVKDFKKVSDYYRWKITTKNNSSNNLLYIRSLLYLTKSNAYLKKYDDNKFLFEEAKSFFEENKDIKSGLALYYNSLGFNNFQQGNFPAAINNFNQALHEYTDDDKHLQEKFYLGMSYWKMNQAEQAIPYFDEIEKNYNETGRISMEFRPMFEFFINHYKNTGNREKQLEYVDKLLNYDHTFAQEQKNLSYKLQTEYDEKQLLAEKSRLQRERERERWGIILASTAVVLGFIFWLIYRRRLKQEEKQKHELLPQDLPQEESYFTEQPYLSEENSHPFISEDTAEKKDNIEMNDSSSPRENISDSEEHSVQSILGENKSETSETEEQQLANENTVTNQDDDIAYIPPNAVLPQNSEPDYSAYYPIARETVVQILKKLDKWEEKRKYLKKNLRLVEMAKEFNTTDKYLARVIKTKTGKIFNHYINDLRFTHLAELLEEDPSIKKKQIKDIAAYLGYVAPEPFINLFREKYGTSPSAYFKSERNNFDNQE